MLRNWARFLVGFTVAVLWIAFAEIRGKASFIVLLWSRFLFGPQNSVAHNGREKIGNDRIRLERRNHDAFLACLVEEIVSNKKDGREQENGLEQKEQIAKLLDLESAFALQASVKVSHTYHSHYTEDNGIVRHIILLHFI